MNNRELDFLLKTVKVPLKTAAQEAAFVKKVLRQINQEIASEAKQKRARKPPY